MPSVNDFSEDEENDGPYSGGGGLGGGGGASSGATNTASKQTETGFVPWSRFVSANEDVSKREANDLNTAVQGQVASATKQRDDATKGFNAGIDSNYDITKPGASVTKPTPQKSAFGSSAASAFGAAQPQQPTGVAAPPSLQQKAPAGMSAMQASPDAPAMELGDKRTLKTSTVANGPTGPKDLQESLGANAWSGLLGDTVRAEGSANALGSETGVQALLQQGGNTPNSAFDAALINGQGRKAFDATSKTGAGLSDGLTKAFGDSQNAWSGLLAESKDTKAMQAKADFEKKATDEADAFNSTLMAPPDEQQAKLQSQIDYLKKNWPVPPEFDTQDEFVNWIATHRNGQSDGGGFSNVWAWADQIYGGHDPKNPYTNIDQFFADVRKMTPAEFEAFKYGVVPAWMGLGNAASGGNGGEFWGLGNTGNKVTAEGTKKHEVGVNGWTQEQEDDWNSKASALATLYQIIVAIAAAGGGPAGAIAGAVGEGIIQATKSQTGVG